MLYLDQLDYSTSNVLFEKIKQQILKDNPKAIIKGTYIQKITCPVCGKAEAWAYTDKPLAIICQRGNKCYAITPIKEIYPELFKKLQEYFPPTKNDPNATATAYLKLRGLDPSKIEYKQGYVFDKDTNKTYPTVEIKIDDQITFHRLIDYTGKDKTRIFGSYQGKVWQPKDLNYAKPIWIVEGIFDAISLHQVSIQAIATLSSAHLPEAFYCKTIEENDPQFVIAFDNDKAGFRAIDKHIELFKSLQIKHKVALAPKDKDWNDCLIEGNFEVAQKEGFLEDCIWQGRLYCAETAEKYFSVYAEYKNINNLIFEFKNQLFKGWRKEKTNKDENSISYIYHVYRVTDCAIDILYSIEDDSIDRQTKTKHIFKVCSQREGTNIVEFSSEELSNLGYFKSKLAHCRQLFFGSGIDLTNTIEYLFKKKSPKIRQCHSIGYDRKSSCFVFSKFLYDVDGKRFNTNHDGYFQKQKLVPFKEKTIESFIEIDIKAFIDKLFKAYAYRGLMAFGFWLSSAFSHLIFDKFGFFPFLSLYGDPRCGKSDLTKLLNRCFFIDWEGISMTKANTQKGELRKISQKSSLVTPMLEGRKDKARFDYDSILPAYNRNPTQIRALTTQGNETQELSFESTLVFVQNNEQFTSKPAKERVVSLRFRETDLSDESYQAWQELSEYSPEQLAFIGHTVFTNRKLFEKFLLDNLQYISNRLKEVIKIDRIAKNHAILLIGVMAFYEILKIPMPEGLPEYVINTAKTKIETARNETLLADYFFDAIEQLNPKNGVIEREDELLIQMPTVLKELKDQLSSSYNETELFEQLKQCDRFKESNKEIRKDGAKKRYWIFKI